MARRRHPGGYAGRIVDGGTVQGDQTPAMMRHCPVPSCQAPPGIRCRQWVTAGGYWRTLKTLHTERKSPNTAPLVRTGRGVIGSRLVANPDGTATADGQIWHSGGFCIDADGNPWVALPRPSLGWRWMSLRPERKAGDRPQPPLRPARLTTED